MTAKASQGTPDGGFLGLLRAVALIAAAAAGCASVALLLRAGPRQKSLLQIVLFTIWVLSPFMALLWANLVSKGWSVVTGVAADGPVPAAERQLQRCKLPAGSAGDSPP